MCGIFRNVCMCVHKNTYIYTSHEHGDIRASYLHNSPYRYYTTHRVPCRMSAHSCVRSWREHSTCNALNSLELGEYS